MHSAYRVLAFQIFSVEMAGRAASALAVTARPFYPRGCCNLGGTLETIIMCFPNSLQRQCSRDGDAFVRRKTVGEACPHLGVPFHVRGGVRWVSAIVKDSGRTPEAGSPHSHIQGRVLLAAAGVPNAERTASCTKQAGPLLLGRPGLEIRVIMGAVRSGTVVLGLRGV